MLDLEHEVGIPCLVLARVPPRVGDHAGVADQVIRRIVDVSVNDEVGLCIEDLLREVAHEAAVEWIAGESAVDGECAHTVMDDDDASPPARVFPLCRAEDVASRPHVEAVHVLRGDAPLRAASRVANDFSIVGHMPRRQKHQVRVTLVEISPKRGPDECNVIDDERAVLKKVHIRELCTPNDLSHLSVTEIERSVSIELMIAEDIEHLAETPRHFLEEGNEQEFSGIIRTNVARQDKDTLLIGRG